MTCGELRAGIEGRPYCAPYFAALEAADPTSDAESFVLAWVASRTPREKQDDWCVELQHAVLPDRLRLLTMPATLRRPVRRFVRRFLDRMTDDERALLEQTDA